MGGAKFKCFSDCFLVCVCVCVCTCVSHGGGVGVGGNVWLHEKCKLLPRAPHLM